MTKPLAVVERDKQLVIGSCESPEPPPFYRSFLLCGMRVWIGGFGLAGGNLPGLEEVVGVGGGALEGAGGFFSVVGDVDVVESHPATTTTANITTKNGA